MQNLNFQQACEKLNLAASTVHQLLVSGKLEGKQVDGEWMVAESAVFAYQQKILAEQTRTVPLSEKIRPYLTRKRFIGFLLMILTAVMFGISSWIQYSGT